MSVLISPEMVLYAIRETYVKTSDEIVKLLLYLTLLTLGLRPIEALDYLAGAFGY